MVPTTLSSQSPATHHIFTGGVTCIFLPQHRRIRANFLLPNPRPLERSCCQVQPRASSANSRGRFARFPWFCDQNLNRTWLAVTRSYSIFDHKTKETLETCFGDLLMLFGHLSTDWMKKQVP